MPDTTTGPTWMVGDDTFAGQTPGRYLTCPDCGAQDGFRVQLDDHDNLIIKCSGHGRTAREPDLHVDMWEAREATPPPSIGRDAPSCVRDGQIVCADDLCHGVDQTVCLLERGIDFDLEEDFDDA